VTKPSLYRALAAAELKAPPSVRGDRLKMKPRIMKALSIRQPWAHLIVHGNKRVENREWQTSYRGPLLIHAAMRKPSPDELALIERDFGVTLDADALRYGAIIGRCALVDVITASQLPWFCGPYGFVLDNVKPINPIRYRGQRGLFLVRAWATSRL
jgi:hypothetical protein